MKKVKENKGITLIALVIIIIVLLILAGISIIALTGENGVLTQVSRAKEQNNKAGIIEEIKLDIASKQIDNLGSINEDELYEILGKYGTVSCDETALTTDRGNYEILITDIYSGNLDEGEHINFYCEDGSVELFKLNKRTLYTETRENAQKAFFSDADELDITAPASSGIGDVVIGINDTEYLTLAVNNNNTYNRQAIIRHLRQDSSDLGQISSSILNYNDLKTGRFLFKITSDTTICIQKYNNKIWEDYQTITLPNGYTTKLGISNMPSKKVAYINNYYKNSINQSTNWTGLKATFYGDSITRDVNKYQYTVSQILGLNEVITCGKGGAQLTNFLSLEENYTTIPTDSDLIFILAGTNDWGGQVAIGNVDDTVETNTFCGKLNKLCQALTTGDYSNCKIVFGTPIHRMTENQTITYSQYCDAIKNVCAQYNIPVIDLYNNCGITTENTSEYLDDGVHPNIKGATLMGNYIAEVLKKINP